MNKETQQNVMKIIIEAGEAKRSIMEAVKFAREEDFAVAKVRLKVAEEQVISTHHIHRSLLASETVNEDINLLVVHAEDHLTSTMVLLEISKELVHIYERIAIQ